ncbi:hypothetical protein CANARDRAFT_26698 [[Candida] arabinofermentans NRRL YB-2248]|uniref:DSC E3 ubiquitin ligase complex subunit 3 C-terminal domain-containing protein n=1 Tax=[Candida] arabinofermentans NRRL YB-2248 TaxID=983967 RepID=A0A1E4T6D1_9ASCO|nr:hypothetical protein CANARDRAFT_26698 [[Candida] arabinofermentans NRRL YB-2248]
MSGNILPLYNSDITGNNNRRATTSTSTSASSTPSSYATATANSTIKQQPLRFEFVIRFADGNPDLIIPVASQQELRDVSTKFIRQQIREHNDRITKNRLKLIRNGKVLLNHTDFQKELKFLIENAYNKDDDDDDDDDSNENGDDDGGVPAPEVIKIYIHCIVGDILTPSELQKEEDLEHQPTKSTSEAPKGFDRLLSQGFSQQDINELRLQFQQIHGSALLGQQDVGALRELEDRWIDSTVNQEIDEFPTNIALSSTIGDGGGTSGLGNGNTLNNTGGGRGLQSREIDTNKELLIGLAIGYFLGVFGLFLIKLEVGGFFNKRTRMAIVAGVGINIAFGTVRAWA